MPTPNSTTETLDATTVDGPDVSGPLDESSPPHAHTRRRGRSLLMAIAAIALIAAGLAGVRAYLGQQRVEAELARVEADRADQKALAAKLRDELAAAEDLSKVATLDSAQARAALESLNEQRRALEAQVLAADGGRGLQAVANYRLTSCIDGLHRAVNQISVGDAVGGASTLGSVQDDCATADAVGPSEMPYDFPDPFVLVEDGTDYAYGTNAGGGNVQLATSTDEKSWKFVGNALPELPAWAEPNATWAPSVLRLGDRYVLYYSLRKRGESTQCVSVAVASKPEGPFVDGSSGPLVCQEDQGGTIDPSPFVDVDGTPYLLYKSEGTPVGRAGALWSQQLNPEGTGFAGFPAMLLAGDPGGWDRGVVEGPSMYRDERGRLWVFYSGAPWSSDEYGVGIASCPGGPTQPCTRANPKPMLTTNDRVVGPGGLEVFRDANGTPKVVFHAYRPGKVGYPNNRVLVIGTLKLDRDTVAMDY